MSIVISQTTEHRVYGNDRAPRPSPDTESQYCASVTLKKNNDSPPHTKRIIDGDAGIDTICRICIHMIATDKLHVMCLHIVFSMVCSVAKSVTMKWRDIHANDSHTHIKCYVIYAN
ncbi:hypothetical protein WA026_010942 [Henosepilachna vigintioctopunctata]|uniref:Uncharacterized protein n=1 Tax=Henosepilachna vigintioctopunctata TaxID=420089 RepID=A0AAW1UPF9_9CUCU